MFFIHFSGFLDDNISQEKTTHPTEKNRHWHHVIVGVNIADWDKKTESYLSDVDFSPWTRRDRLNLAKVIDTGTVDTRQLQSFAFHVTIGDEHFRTIDFDSIIFPVARCMITEMYWQCDIEILPESLVYVNFEWCRFCSGLFDINETVNECSEFVESIKI